MNIKMNCVKVIQISLVLVCLSLVVSAQNKKQLTAANGAIYIVDGSDRVRANDELVVYSAEFYSKTPTSNSGVDVLVANGKVAEIRDRAGAVFLEKKADPGALKPAKDSVILSGNGTARKWILANLKVGDAVSINTYAAGKEIPPPASAPCFAGAYYRKAVSSFDVWTGIAGFVKLGKPQTDENRLDAQDGKPLDNFSVYMGGNAGGRTEVDAGLTWEFTTDANGKKSERRNAFRPFWRTKTWNSAPDKPEFYFYPGETVQMAVIVVGANKLKLVVSDGKSKTFQVDFDAEGFASGVPRQFKRVNAIDQRRNEGKPAQKTDAEVTGAEWLQTILMRGDGAATQQLPMTQERYTDMRCPNVKNIVVTETDKSKGGEKVNIFGKEKN